jgi:uncharacterized protein YjbI with pentapeptide repeats
VIRWGLRERRWRKADGEEVEPAKTLWDVAQLLVVPAMLAAIAIGFNASQSSRDEQREDARVAEDRTRAEDVRHEQNLQRYFDRISDLLLAHDLKQAREGSAVRDVARNVTLATLRTLDGPRKAQVVAFLSDAGLLRTLRRGQDDDSIVSLSGADLSGADFRSVAHLEVTSLGATDLRGARFDRVALGEVAFALADLRGASFRDAQVAAVSFDGADLRRARFDRASIGTAPGGTVRFTETCLSGRASTAPASSRRASPAQRDSPPTSAARTSTA